MLAASPMARRRSTPDSEVLDAAAAAPCGTACLPRAVFGLLLVLLVALAAVEVRNALRHPSVLRAAPPKSGPALTFYQKGRAAAREAWLCDEPQGSSGPPRLIQRIDCRPDNTLIGEIRWTGDGKAVYAAGRTPVQRGVPELRWLFEFGSGRLFVATPGLALPGRTAFVEDSANLTSRWRRHQGAGALAAAWYALGAQGPHLFSWQTTRWENALPGS